MNKTKMGLLALILASNLPQSNAAVEAAIADTSNQASVAETQTLYSRKLEQLKADFQAAPTLESQQQVLNRYLAYAHSEIYRQTGGEGVTYQTLMAAKGAAQNLSNSGLTSTALKSIELVFGNFARILK